MKNNLAADIECKLRIEGDFIWINCSKKQLSD